MDQRDTSQILKRADQLQAEFEEEVAQLRREYRKRLLETMSAPQREQLEKMLAEKSSLYLEMAKF